MQSGGKNICHSGRIVRIEGDSVEVLVERQAACSGCRAKSVCGIDTDKDSFIIIKDIQNDKYSVNEEVTVSMKQSMGMKAVFYVYILPFLFVLGTLIVLLQNDASEVFSGLVSLGVLAVYYFILYLLRSKIEKDIVFNIEKSDNNVNL